MPRIWASHTLLDIDFTRCSTIKRSVIETNQFFCHLLLLLHKLTIAVSSIVTTDEYVQKGSLSTVPKCKPHSTRGKNKTLCKLVAPSISLRLFNLLDVNHFHVLQKPPPPLTPLRHQHSFPQSVLSSPPSVPHP